MSRGRKADEDGELVGGELGTELARSFERGELLHHEVEHNVIAVLVISICLVGARHSFVGAGFDELIHNW